MYIRLSDGVFPLYIGDILLANPGFDPESDALPDGWAKVSVSEYLPELKEGEKHLLVGPAQDEDGNWSITFEATPMSEEEIAALTLAAEELLQQELAEEAPAE